MLLWTSNNEGWQSLYCMRQKYPLLRYFIFEKSVNCVILKSKIRCKIITSHHKNILKSVQFTISVTTVQSPFLTRTMRILTGDVLAKRGCSWDSSEIVGVWPTSSRSEILWALKSYLTLAQLHSPLVKATRQFSQYITKVKNERSSTFGASYTHSWWDETPQTYSTSVLPRSRINGGQFLRLLEPFMWTILGTDWGEVNFVADINFCIRKQSHWRMEYVVLFYV